MIVIGCYLTNFYSGYCCLNSIAHTGIDALAWYAVDSTEPPNDPCVHSPNRELVARWVGSSFHFLNTLKTGALP